MTITAQAVDSTEPISDTVWELVANQRDYGVVNGCDVTPDATDLTYDVAAGNIMHNGTMVGVAAQTDAGTLVADGSNPRFSWIGLDSSGVDVLVSGDASADPVVPELGDRVALSLMRIPAAETLASNCTDIEKRIMLAEGRILKALDETVNSTTTPQSDDDFKFTIAAGEIWMVDATLLVNSGTTPDIKLGWTLANTSYYAAIVLAQGTPTGMTQSAEQASGNMLTVQAAGAAAILWIRYLVVSTTGAGVVNFQWAQGTSDAGNTTIMEGSSMTFRRVGT